ncbi:MAG TPA: hypothetical protein VF442_06615, partial [Sphingobium sp.]
HWEWIDERLPRLRDLGVDVIAGLIDDGFAAGLARLGISTDLRLFQHCHNNDLGPSLNPHCSATYHR